MTLPTWLLAVVWLTGSAYWHWDWELYPGHLLAFVVTVWGLVALVGQLAGVLINATNLPDSLRPIDGALRRLALLNMAHTGILIAGFVAMWFLPDGLWWMR